MIFPDIPLYHFSFYYRNKASSIFCINLKSILNRTIYMNNLIQLKNQLVLTKIHIFLKDIGVDQASNRILCAKVIEYICKDPTYLVDIDNLYYCVGKKFKVSSIYVKRRMQYIINHLCRCNIEQLNENTMGLLNSCPNHLEFLLVLSVIFRAKYL